MKVYYIIALLFLTNFIFSQNYAYIATSSAQGSKFFNLLKLDLTSCQKELLHTIPADIHEDIALNPIDGKLYFMSDEYVLSRIDPITGVLERIKAFADSATAPYYYPFQFTALEFDQYGNLYTTKNNKIFKIETQNKYHFSTYKELDRFEFYKIEGITFLDNRMLFKDFRNRIFELDTITKEYSLILDSPYNALSFLFANNSLSNSCINKLYGYEYFGIIESTLEKTKITKRKVCPIELGFIDIYGIVNLNEHQPQYAITETEISVNGDQSNQIFDFCIGEAINLAGNTPNTNNFEKNQWQTISKGESVWVTSKELEINNIVAKKAGTDTLIYRFVSERDGCMSTDTAIIQISDYPNKKIIGDSLICDNQTTSIILKDSTKPTKINWFWNGITLKDTTNTLSKLTKEGTYWATLDNGICPKTNTDTLILKVHQLTEAIAQSNKLSNIFCISDDIQLLGNTPKPKETPAWKFLENKPSITIETPNAATTKIKVIEAKTATVEYSIRLQTEDCVKKDTLTIRILDYPQAKLGGDTAICQTQIATLYSITDQKNTQLNWYKNGKLFSVQDSIKIILQSSTYTVGVKNNVCPEVLSNAIKLRIDTLPKGYILLDGKENSEIVEGTPVEISSTDPNAQNEWAIQPSEYLFAPNTTKGWWQSENKYGLNTLYLTSQNGLCTQQDTAFLYVKAKLKAPNVFTSNGDGINETFAIRGIETHPEARVSIYNRWGEQVYSTKNYADNEWNGTNCSEGVYYYIIATALQDHTGVVHLFR